MTLTRIFKITLFITVHALIALLLMSWLNPAWMAVCGVIGAALATLFLILFVGDDQAASLFFFENWAEMEQTGSQAAGCLMSLVWLAWGLPGLGLFCVILLILIVRG